MDLTSFSNAISIITGLGAIVGAAERVFAFLRARTKAKAGILQASATSAASALVRRSPFAYPALFVVSIVALVLGLINTFVVYPGLVADLRTIQFLAQQVQNGGTVDQAVATQVLQHFFSMFALLMALSTVAGLIAVGIAGFGVIRSAQLRRLGWSIGIAVLAVLLDVPGNLFVVLAIHDGFFHSFGGQLFSQFTTGVSPALLLTSLPYGALVFSLWGPTTSRSAGPDPVMLQAGVMAAHSAGPYVPNAAPYGTPGPGYPYDRR